MITGLSSGQKQTHDMTEDISASVALKVSGLELLTGMFQDPLPLQKNISYTHKICVCLFALVT